MEPPDGRPKRMEAHLCEYRKPTGVCCLEQGYLRSESCGATGLVGEGTHERAVFLGPKDSAPRTPSTTTRT